jgi:hypothetical protein
MEHFDEIEEIFRQLLGVSEAALSPGELDEVRHFVDVCEYGLALETAIDIFAEERKKPPVEAMSYMAQLAEKMGLDVAELLKPLHPAPDEKGR